MTSPKTNTTILYIILLLIGTVQIVMVSKQIQADWIISQGPRRFLLVLRFLINLAFLVIFAIKLKKITTLNSDNKGAGEL